MEKRLILVDRLLTSGYSSLNLCVLAQEVSSATTFHPIQATTDSQLGLKKKQLVNQLTPGRTGSIRELCMNAAARTLDPCGDCKKKMANMKRKADAEGLQVFLRGDERPGPEDAGQSRLASASAEEEEDDDDDCLACNESEEGMEEDELADGDDEVEAEIAGVTKAEGEKDIEMVSEGSE